MNDRKVLLVTQSVRGGGAEQVAQHWVSLLASGGVEVITAVLQKAEPTSTGSSVAGAPVIHLPSGTIARLRRLRNELKLRRPSAVVGVLTYPNLLILVAGMGLGIRTIISEHTVPSVLLRTAGARQRAQLYLARFLYRRASAAIAVSHAVATDLRLSFRVKPIRLWVIPNQVFRADNSVRGGGHRTRHTGNVSSTGPIKLVIPGRITWAKRPRFVLEIAAELHNRGRDTSVEFIGEARDGFPAELLTSAPDINVTITPWADEWTERVGSGSVVLLPSDVEGFGNVLVQAARARLMSVAGSASLGVGDAIVPGVTGLFATPDTASAFADAVEAVLELEFGELGNWLERFGNAGLSDALLRVTGTGTRPRV